MRPAILDAATKFNGGETPGNSFAQGVRQALLGRDFSGAGLEAGEARRGYEAALDQMTDPQRQYAAGVRYVLVDTDGNSDALIPLLMDAGVDGIWPMERASDMDPIALRKKYGRAPRRIPSTGRSPGSSRVARRRRG